MLMYAVSYASKFVKRLVRKEEGATLVEYCLLIALIALACVGGVTALGAVIPSFFSGASDHL